MRMNPNFPTSAFQSLERATAKYDYTPPPANAREDSPKLALKKGDLIYIIAKDPSNWWNGIILDTNTSRTGWFPASYVKLHTVSKDENTKDRISIAKSDTESLKGHANAKDSVASESSRGSSPSGPKVLSTNSIIASRKEDSVESNKQSRNREAFSAQLSGLKQSLSELALTGLTSPRSSPSQPVVPSTEPPQSAIPRDSPGAKDWKMKMADNGRMYYYNVRTDQTSWNAPDGPDTIKEISPHLSIASPEILSPSLQKLSDWDNLIQSILMAIAALNQDSKIGANHKYLQHSTVTSINIRYMLKCCGCLDKTSVFLHENRKLRRAHVTLFNTLSAFIRAVRVAVGVWPPPSAVNEMRKAAGSVLLHVREFVKAATEEGVPLVLTPPHEELAELSTLLGPNTTVTFEDGQFKVLEMPETNAEITEKFRFFLSNVQTAVETLLTAIEQRDSIANEDTQSLVKQVGDVLAYIDELQSKGILPSDKTGTDQLINKMITTKEKLLASLHSTITSIDAACTQLTSPFALQQVMLDTTILLTALKDVIIAIKTFLEKSLPNTSEKSEDTTRKNMKRSLSTGVLVVDTPPPPLRALANANGTRTRAATGTLPKIETNFRALPHLSRNDTLLPSPSASGITPYSSDHDRGMMSSRESDRLHEHEVIVRNPKLRAVLGGENSPEPPLSPVGRSSTSGLSSRHSVEPLRSDSADWYLHSDIDQRDIVLSMDGEHRIKAATLDALIDKMCDINHSDPTFASTILLTFRLFTSPIDFFNQLITRFNVAPPLGLSLREKQIWSQKKQIPTQYRVCGILLQWIERNYIKKSDFEVLPMLRSFVAKSLAEAFPAEFDELSKVTKARLLDGNDLVSLADVKVNKGSAPPAPIIPKGSATRLIDFDPLEIARQLTILDAAAFRAIESNEWLTYKPAVKRRSLADIAAADDGGNIRRMITLSNKIAGWVAQTILYEEDLKKRCGLIKTFAKVAEHCHQLNNFATRESILAGLKSSPIYRLKRTFEHVSSKTKALIEDLMKHMDRDNNFRSYRESLKRVSGTACVPFTGLYMTDFTFILDGNPTRVYNDRLINVEKFVKVGAILTEIRGLQLIPYYLTPVREIQDFLDKGLGAARDADSLFDLSMQLEPREKEDEKILRLLQEKGFG